MITDTIKNTSTGKLSFGIDKDESISAIISFLKENLELFIIDSKILPINEKGISQNLCIFLNRKAKKQPYFFHAEYMENVNSGTSPQVDIGVIAEDEKIEISDKIYLGSESFFSIEAKRLPTPGHNREKEYVIGVSSPCGGIERFKKGIHGLKIKHAAIIGYIQKENFNFWLITINSWIDELAKINLDNNWTQDDRINGFELFDSKLSAGLYSKHSRKIDGQSIDYINLHHFWLKLDMA